MQIPVNKIRNMITDFEQIKNNYSVWVVANVADTVQSFETYIKHANYTEFFSKAEFASIISAITGIFGYVRIFYSELELISYILAHKNTINAEHIIVYNFARDGQYEGKKSLIPSICDLFGIGYIGSNAFVVSLLRNKFVYTKYLEALGIPVPKSVVFKKTSEFDPSLFKSNDPIIVKNIFESASIGISNENIITVWDALCIDHSLQHLCSKMNMDQVLIQEFIEGAECEVFVINYCGNYHAFSPVELIIHNASILTASISENYEYSFTALSDDFSIEICNDIMKTTEIAAQALNIKNYARFDFRISDNGAFFLIDIAGSPYLTRHSSVSYLFKNILNLQYSDIFSILAALTCKNQSLEVNCRSDSNNPREK